MSDVQSISIHCRSAGTGGKRPVAVQPERRLSGRSLRLHGYDCTASRKCSVSAALTQRWYSRQTIRTQRSVPLPASELTLAKDSLRAREETSAENIGSWIPGAPAPNQFLALPGWAAAHGVDAVIWTALRGKWHESDTRRPTCEEILGYLSSLTGNARDAAERYIRSAPTQIDTRYRREIEAALAWTPLSGSPGM